MIDTIPMPLGPSLPPDTRSDVVVSLPPEPSAPAERVLQVVFTGSGSEYFRIWIVNLLLTLVTLGLYYPWAKVRRLRYFHGNTVVGDHAMDFHGDPASMLRGHLLVGAMVALYAIAGRVSPAAGLIAFAIVAAIWPALWRAALRFRLANTSWRGLRFHFTGDTAGAYRAMLPMFVPGLLFVVAAAMTEPTETAHQSGPAAVVTSIAMLLTCVLVPLAWWLIKRYQHDHYALGQVETRLKSGPGAFYGLFLKAFVIGMLMGTVAGVVGGVAALASGPRSGAGGIVVIGIVVTYLLMIVVLVPFMTARLQNLVWGRTQSRRIRFESTLRFRAMLGLTLGNWLLMLLTLGFYWPFAQIATARLRLSALSVITRGDLDELMVRLEHEVRDATGDAAGDLFGIDLGL